jgi:hypothetical protein
VQQILPTPGRDLSLGSDFPYVIRGRRIVPSSNQLRRSHMSVAFQVVDILPQNPIAHLESSGELLRPFFGICNYLIDNLYDRIGCDVQLTLQKFAFHAKCFKVCLPGNEWHKRDGKQSASENGL